MGTENDDEKIVLGKVSDELLEDFKSLRIKNEAINMVVKMLLNEEAGCVTEKMRLWKLTIKELDIPTDIQKVNPDLHIDEDTGEVKLTLRAQRDRPYLTRKTKEWLESKKLKRTTRMCPKCNNEMAPDPNPRTPGELCCRGCGYCESMEQPRTETKPTISTHYYTHCNLISRGDVITFDPDAVNCPDCASRLLSNGKGPKA